MPARLMGAAAACASRSLPCPTPPHPSFPPDRAGHGRRPASRACAASAGPSRQPIASVPRAAAPARVPLWVWPSCAFCARLGPPVCVRLCDRGPKPSVEVVAGRRAGGVCAAGASGTCRDDEPCGCACRAPSPRAAALGRGPYLSPFGGPLSETDFRRVTALNFGLPTRRSEDAAQPLSKTLSSLSPPLTLPGFSDALVKPLAVLSSWG